MGVMFELVVNFGNDVQAAESALHATERHPSVRFGDISLPLTERLTNPRDVNGQTYAEFSVHPQGLSYAIGDQALLPHNPQEVSRELTEVAFQLYDLLKTFPDFLAASVGFDPESEVDVSDLENDFLRNELEIPVGIVLANRFVDRWQLRELKPFSPGYHWQPFHYPFRLTSQATAK